MPDRLDDHWNGRGGDSRGRDRRPVGGDVDRASLVVPLAVALLAGFLPSTELIAIAFVAAVVAMGHRWPGHPFRTAVLLVAPAVVVLSVRVLFVGLEDLGLAGLGVLGWVGVAMTLGFAVVALTLLAALGSVVATGRAMRRARGPEPWDRSRVVATVTLAVAAVVVFGVPIVLTILG